MLSKRTETVDDRNSHRHDQSYPYLEEKQLEVDRTYQELQNLIGDLDQKFDKVLERHEKDFLSAYRGHMLKVQKQLNFLRKKAKEQEIKLKKDERINNLQKSLDWFRKEALKLGKTCEYQKKEIEKYKAKADSYEEDMKFLEQQIKGSKKQNKLLKVALGKSQHQCEQLIAIAEDNLPHQKMESILHRPDFDEESLNQRMAVATYQKDGPMKALPAPEGYEIQEEAAAIITRGQISKELDIDGGDLPTLLPAMIPELESQEKKQSIEILPEVATKVERKIEKISSRPKTGEQRKISNAKEGYSLPGNKRFQSFLLNLLESEPDRPTLMTELAGFFNNYDQRVEEVIANLKGQLEAEKRLSRRLKNIKTEEISERNKYENIFFDAVESVKRDIMKRKNAASSSRLMTKKSESTLMKLAKTEEEGGAELIDLLRTKPENFTAADKKRLLDIFVTNEQILLLVYESLFVKQKSRMHENLKRGNEQSFHSNPLTSTGQMDYSGTEAFLTKLPGEEDFEDQTRRGAEAISERSSKMSRFKTSFMPNSVHHQTNLPAARGSMYGEFTTGARRMFSGQNSAKRGPGGGSLNVGKLRRSKNSELVRSVRPATRGHLGGF